MENKIEICLDELDYHQLHELLKLIQNNDKPITKHIDILNNYLQTKYKNLPLYVECGSGGITLQLITDEDDNIQYYYRLAGAWSCKYKFIDGELYSDEPEFIIPDRKLIPITYEKWFQTNLGYH